MRDENNKSDTRVESKPWDEASAHYAGTVAFHALLEHHAERLVAFAKDDSGIRERHTLLQQIADISVLASDIWHNTWQRNVAIRNEVFNPKAE